MPLAAWSRKAPVCWGVHTMTGPGTCPVSRQWSTRSSVQSSGPADPARRIRTRVAGFVAIRPSAMASLSALRRVARIRWQVEGPAGLSPRTEARTAASREACDKRIFAPLLSNMIRRKKQATQAIHTNRLI